VKVVTCHLLPEDLEPLCDEPDLEPDDLEPLCEEMLLAEPELLDPEETERASDIFPDLEKFAVVPLLAYTLLVLILWWLKLLLSLLLLSPELRFPELGTIELLLR
jgi:hypothetical protein